MTDFDPFGDVPADDPQPAPFEEQEPAPKKAVKKAAPKVQEVDDGFRLGITTKGGAGFDVPWLTPSYPSWAAAAESLTDPETQQHIVTVMSAVAKMNAAFQKLVAAAAPEKPSGGSGGAPARPGAEAPAGTPEAPGPDWTYKTGVGKNGKTWKAWMPPRGSNEQPVWL